MFFVEYISERVFKLGGCKISVIREMIENNEKLILSEKAAKSCDSKGRVNDEPKCNIRTDYQRDRDRIIHSAAFRRLKHKTQVYIAPEGDHYRTRLTHTLEVSQIARTVARALRLNEDLTEAIALGHDLGHTPFGHAGERALDRCLANGFKHFEQSVRVVELIEKNGNGLNLTYEVKDGILCHTNMTAATLEGNVVRFADKIAYLNHDIDDSIKAGVLKETDIPADIREVLGKSKSIRINKMVTSLINASTNGIALSDDVNNAFEQLHDFLYNSVYINPVAKGEEHKAESLLETLFEYYQKNPDELPEKFKNIALIEGNERASADYIAGMTDRYAMNVYYDLFIPKSWGYSL